MPGDGYLTVGRHPARDATPAMTNCEPRHQRRNPALSFVREAVQMFLGEAWRSGERLDLTCVDRLCEWALSPDPQVARAATAAVFGGIIEPLCDDFSSEGVNAANLVLTRMLQWIRATPQGMELDRRLNDFGFADVDSILRRYKQISRPTPLAPSRLASVGKVIILSRVTAGADIAISNVIVQRLRQRLPKAELIMIGPSHLPGLFASVAGCRFRNFVYKNDGGLFEKMTSWPRLVELTAKECDGFKAHEVLLFDPDTRLTQLGLLPLVPEGSTCYFPSRMTPAPELADSNLSILANEWLNCLLGEDKRWRPSITFPCNGHGYHSFVGSLRDRGCRLAVAINFGVGNDPRKRVGDDFEARVVSTLLAIPDTVVILDTGRGVHKEQWIQGHLDQVAQLGLPAIRLAEDELKTCRPAFGHGLIVFRGLLGSLGKMIAAADCFIGYDSCGQHLADATGTPAVVLFAGAPSERFIRRWSPEGPDSRIIPVSGRLATPEAMETLIQTVTQAVEELRASQSNRDNHAINKT